MTEKKDYLVLAFYDFTAIKNPLEEVKIHKEYFESRDITSRIYISEEGINGQMSASREAGMAYIDWMHSRCEFKDTEFKIHYWHEHVFPRKQVKYRKQLVAIDKELDVSKTCEHLSPKSWKEMLETSKDHLLIDVRNDYESKVGYFDGAELPPCNTFREFNTYTDELVERIEDKKKPIMMYCTGGIRCELYSVLLKEKGFENVYQLDGGVIGYGLKEGSSHWKGRLYVFDDRMTVPISDEPTEVVGRCESCQAPSENYYNCANMDCNKLFLCCDRCLEECGGCCQESCKEAPRVRPFQQQNPHKPFKKYYQYFGFKGSKVAS